MSKKKIALFSTIAIVLLVGVCAFLSPWAKKPFANLNSEEIVSIAVCATPPNETKLIEDKDTIREIIDVLKTVEIYQKGDYSDYSGQLVRFSLTMESGEIIEVGAYNPFIIIDGQAYKTKYKPCEKLNSLGNKLLRTGF